MLKVRIPTPPKRVKLYELCKDEWSDKGTGFCSGELINEEPYIIVVNEENRHEILLRKLIAGKIQFHKQQETLIVWTEADNNDMALSFQEADGCSLVCDFLIHVQRSFAEKISVSVVTQTEEGDFTELIAGPLNYPPPPSFEALPEIVRCFSDLHHIHFARESFSTFLTETDYIHNLIGVFNKAEERQSLPELHNIYKIVKFMCEYFYVCFLFDTNHY